MLFFEVIFILNVFKTIEITYALMESHLNASPMIYRITRANTSVGFVFLLLVVEFGFVLFT